MKRLKILFVFMLLGTLFVSQMSGNAATSATKAEQDASGNNIASTYIKNISAAGTKLTITKGDGTTSEIATQDTTYTAGSNISISNNVISAVVPSISITSDGAIQNQNGNSLTANYIDLSNPSSVKTGSSISATAAATYLIFQKGYLPLVAYTEENVDDEKFVFKA